MRRCMYIGARNLAESRIAPFRNIWQIRKMITSRLYSSEESDMFSLPMTQSCKILQITDILEKIIDVN